MAIKFAVVLPEPPASADDWDEIYYGKLIVSIEGKSPLEFAVEKSVQQTPDRRFTNEGFLGPQQAVVTLDYSYIDDAGNQGASVTAAIELQDTVPPVAPTAIGIVQIEEVPD